MFTRTFIAVAVFAAALLASPARATEEPFALADVVPSDVEMFLHVEDAAGLRRWLQGRPLGDWVDATLAGGDLQKVWTRMAASIGSTPAALLDRVLGRRATLVTRRAGASGAVGDAFDPANSGPVAWAVMLEVAPGDLAALTSDRVKMDVRRGTVVKLLRDHDLLLATARGWTIVGPSKQADLFYDVLDRFAGRGDAPTLNDSPACQRGRDFGPARVAVLMNHELPLGGWTVAAATLDCDVIELQQASSFSSSPFQRSVTKCVTDFAPVESLEDATLVTIIEPTDVEDGLVGRFLETSLGQPLVSPAMADRVGARRIITVGESEGRLLEDPVDLLSTTVAVCIELEPDTDLPVAIEAIDDHMERLAWTMNTLGEGAFVIDYELQRPAAVKDPRRIDIGPASGWLTGNFPIMRNIELNWTVIDGPTGKWYVVATHGTHLSEVVTAMARAPRGEALIGQFDAAGSLDGVRIGKHLRSWAERPELFIDPAAGQAAIDDFGNWLRSVASFADGIDGARWAMRRPSQNELELQVRMTPTGARSAGGSHVPSPVDANGRCRGR